MQNSLEDDLEDIFVNTIFLLYHSRCIWSDQNNCNGSPEIVFLTNSNHLRYDFNNAVLMCTSHREWWQSGDESAYQLLFKTHPGLATFHLNNHNLVPKFKPDLEAIRAFVAHHSTQVIAQQTAPFPTLYGV